MKVSRLLFASALTISGVLGDTYLSWMGQMGQNLFGLDDGVAKDMVGSGSNHQHQGDGGSEVNMLQDLKDGLGEKFSQQLEHFDMRKLGNLRPEVFAAWRDLEQELTPEALKKKVGQYLESMGKSSAKSVSTEPQGPQLKTTNGQFEVLSQGNFPDYRLRIKKSNVEVLGLDTVDQYTGYLDVEASDKHFFYWFFESRNDPKNDPVVLWLNGGPGCSSATGLFFELGPSFINASIQPQYNPYSWNSNASVIFLDQPVGVGYSYAGNEDISSTDAASKDVFIFLELFFQKFPEFLNNKFHIAGESYAGHYIPRIASEIINRADRSFTLDSILIGNGITDSLIQYHYYKPMACGEGGYKQVISDRECQTLDDIYPRCAALVQACYILPNAFTCVPAETYCSRLVTPYQRTGLNMYDIRRKCEGTLCYKEMEYMEEYLNYDFVKEAVGASNVKKFQGCNDAILTRFLFSGDNTRPFQGYVAELLERDIPVLLYAGDKDYICNWLGNHAWSDALEYSKHAEFERASLKPWYTANKKHAGEVKNYDKFTFLRVFDAGHMVPFDQPENALDMFNRWLAGDYSYGHKKE